MRPRSNEIRLARKRGLSNVLIACALAAAGCGETNIQAIARLRPSYAVHRDWLSAIARDLPAPNEIGDEERIPEEMSPPPVFFEGGKNDPRATLEILELEDLAGKRAPLTLSIRSPVHFCLAWTGPDNPLQPVVWGDRTGLGPECSAALRRPWLVLLRTVEYDLPRLFRAEAFVVHVPTGRLAAWLPVEVRGAHPEKDSADSVHSAFYLAYEYELLRMLGRLPGAQIELDRSPRSLSFRGIAIPRSMSTPNTPLQVPEVAPPQAPSQQAPSQQAPMPQTPPPQTPVPQEI